jgi:hypothetical protein
VEIANPRANALGCPATRGWVCSKLIGHCVTAMTLIFVPFVTVTFFRRTSRKLQRILRRNTFLSLISLRRGVVHWNQKLRLAATVL